MEDVLDVYTRPYDPRHPFVCFDESNKQLVAETREPLPAEPGKPERYDYQYERNGVNQLKIGDWRLEIDPYLKEGAIRLKIVDYSLSIISIE